MLSFYLVLVRGILGLPGPHFSYIRKIVPGLPLFLFNYSDRKLHGIFEAAGPGLMNIDPYGWTDQGKERTPFPAQVEIVFHSSLPFMLFLPYFHIDLFLNVQAPIFSKILCHPLEESVFRPVISNNYYTQNHFHFELDRKQTSNLLSLFQPVEPQVDSRSSHFTTTSENVWIPLPRPFKGKRGGNSKVIDREDKGKSKVESYSQSSQSSRSTEENEENELDFSSEEIAFDTKKEGIPWTSGFCLGEEDAEVSPEDFPVIEHCPRRIDDIMMKLKNLAKSSKSAATSDVPVDVNKKTLASFSTVQVPSDFNNNILDSSLSSHDHLKTAETIPDDSMVIVF